MSAARAVTMTLKQARSIADTSIRTQISDADIAAALSKLFASGRGVATRDALRMSALRAELSFRSYRAALVAA